MFSRSMPALAVAVLISGTSMLAGAGAAADAAHPAVLELFTSQGCSSCPAADALFKTYARRQDVVALSMPVDYWDYLGWKDTLANPKFSKRQRAYAKLRGDGQVYTPQIVVNGRHHVVGSAQKEIDAALAADRATEIVGAIKSTIADGMITIEVPAAARIAPDATIWLVVVQAEAQVMVRGGENRDRALTYFNVVRDLLPLGMWSGGATAIKQRAADLPGNMGDRYAVLLQAGIGGPIIAAAWAEPAR